VPYLGGLAVLLGMAVVVVLFHRDQTVALVLLALVCALGLYDDLVYATVGAKLVGELGVAIAAVALGFTWHLTDSQSINVGISLLWLVGMTNSFNLLDNMDGLTSTVAATALAGLVWVTAAVTPVAAPLGGALVGFLLVNRPPARMYLGDAGSLMVGLGLGLFTIRAANTGRGLHALVLLACPVALALFDTSLVVVSRLWTGRPVQLGGRDHFSHRLQLLGWTRGQILLGAFGVTAVAIVIAKLAGGYPLAEAWLAVPLGIALLGAWVGLIRVDPYRAADSKPEVWTA
jgi:UDP-GlcNAc:undecaprenyl-phosphate GlcNAc-1-phosphate transferase